MKFPKFLFICLFIPLSGFADVVTGKVQLPCSSVSVETCKVANSLGRGINLGNMLEAPKEGDWGVWAESRFIDIVGKSFNNVRVPVRWSNHATPDDKAVLDDWFAKRVEKVVDSLLEKDVYVVLNMHHYSQLFGDKVLPGEFEVDPQVAETRLLNMWQQIAEKYKDKSPKLIFEILNEPHGKMDSQQWNQLLAKALLVIRRSNPNRIVMIGPTSWNAVKDLPKLKLPNDRNLIVQIHNYEPFNFTHQGITFLPVKFPIGTKCCDAGQRKKIADDLASANQWSQSSGYPLYLGEFGAFEKADMASRAEYARVVRDEAEKYGIGWAYWEFASSFGVYNPKTSMWYEPLRRSLLD